MDHRLNLEYLTERFERTSATHVVDRTRYELYVEASQVITKKLRDVVESRDRDLREMRTRLVELARKTNTQANVVDQHRYSRRLVTIFTRWSWQKRHVHYLHILQRTRTMIDAFYRQMSIDDIDDADHQTTFVQLCRIEKTVTEQMTKQKSFFVLME
jgi:hypothetical protein